MSGLIGCGSPTAPSPAFAISFADPVAAQRVVCASCTVEPREWAVAEFPVTVTAPPGRSGAVASVETRVTNRTRGGVELGRNVRPNRDYAYGDTQVPPGGSLVLAAGVVFHPLPAAGDEVRIEVVATLMDGRTARHGSAVTVAP